MLDQQPKGDAWIERGAEKEDEDNAFRIALRSYVASLAQLGLRPHFVSAAMLPGLRDKLLILPDTLALSPADAQAIAAFAAHGGVVVADTQPGLYDAHSRRLPRPALAPAVARPVAPGDKAALASLLMQAGVQAPLQVSAPLGDVELYVFRRGGRTIVAVQRNKPAAEEEEDVVLALPRPALVTDLLAGGTVGPTDRLTLKLGAVEPAILSLQ